MCTYETYPAYVHFHTHQKTHTHTFSICCSPTSSRQAECNTHTCTSPVLSAQRSSRQAQAASLLAHLMFIRPTNHPAIFLGQVVYAARSRHTWRDPCEGTIGQAVHRLQQQGIRGPLHLESGVAAHDCALVVPVCVCVCVLCPHVCLRAYIYRHDTLAS